MRDRGLHEGVDELLGADISLLRKTQRRHDRRRQGRFERGGLVRIQQHVLDAGGRKPACVLFEHGRFRLRERHLQRAVARVVDVDVGIGAYASDELVVDRKAARCEMEKCGIIAFDRWSEDARGGERRATARFAGIEQRDLRAASRELVRDGAAGDAGADDDDLHETILCGQRES
jgi:hypothetical protein